MKKKQKWADLMELLLLEYKRYLLLLSFGLKKGVMKTILLLGQE
ncbi:hypothetical protein BAP_3146 [Bacillus sp. CN2]|nr:hypothetical protein BAP_3146 [Bacillus sp. CN2]